MNVELMAENGGVLYPLPVVEGITWDTARRGEPGKLSFSVVKDKTIKMTEGNPVRLTVNGTNLFYGFIFQMKQDKGETIEVTAYDQLRYLKNKDLYQYTNKTADQVIRMIAADFRLNVGYLEHTRYIIPSRIEDNKTLFDIILTALDLTTQNTGRLYVLYDDFGRLTLRDTESLRLNLLIDEETGENYDYTSSIDGETYNKIKLVYDNKDTGTREVYIAQDINNINAWGMLQYFEKLNDGENGRTKADALLRLYNRKTRNLRISGAVGDVRVRAGASVVVKLNLGDVRLQNYMLVEKAKHTFNEGRHTMDLTLRGGEFVA